MEKGFTIQVLDKGYVRYVDHFGDDKRIVESARISYKSPSKGDEQDKRLLEYLWKNQHSSPLEMVKITFNIKMPIFVMRQYVRHRVQNLNEQSLRYTEAKEEFYIPNSWRRQDVKNKQGSTLEESWDVEGAEGRTKNEELSALFLGQCEDCYNTYKTLLKEGVSREMARMVLPINLYTEIYSCWDLRNLLHFISLREDSHAQAEIQEYAKAMKQIAKELFPWTIEIFDKYKFKLMEAK
jgi:thymidylate synthase (FAD)